MLDVIIARFDRPGWLDELIESGDVPDLIETAREAETSARRVRQWFESLLDPATPDRHCPVCSAAIRGRSDRRYCSDACRQKAHRASRLKP